VAAKFRTTVPQLMGINKGVSTLSTGMAIKVPQYQYSAPIGPLPGGGNLPSTSNLGPSVSTMQGGFTPSRFGPIPTQTTTTNVTAPKLPAPTVTGRGTGNFNMNATQQTSTPTNAPTTTGNIYNNPYESIMYQRDANGNPQYNYVQMRDQYGRPMTNRDGTPVTTPASIYSNDVMNEARHAGQSVAQFTEDLKKNGYVLFGGKWVYVGTGTPQPTGQPARNAHGSLIRRKEVDTAAGGAVPGAVSTSSSNFGVGSG